jgi:hypothetical protein
MGMGPSFSLPIRLWHIDADRVARRSPSHHMKLTKPEYLGGSWHLRSRVIESGFAAYAQCYPDLKGTGTIGQDDDCF